MIPTPRSSGPTGPDPVEPAPSNFGGGDVVPLSNRVLTLSGIRLVIGLALLAVAIIAGRIHRIADLRDLTDLLWPLLYLLVASLLSGATLLVKNRSAAVGGLGLVLCLDGVMLQVVQHRLGPGLSVELAVGVFLVSVCLLASFRTGLKLVIWQSLLITVDRQGTGTGLFGPSPSGTSGRIGAAVPIGAESGRIAPELILLWALVLVVCVAASVNERELRRRRHDAETLQGFATALHRDDELDLVLRRTMAFVVEELNAGRALVCGRPADRFVVLASHGLDVVGAETPEADELTTAAAADSGLLRFAGQPGEPALLLSLDPKLDPWLAAILPAARRLMVLPLSLGSEADPLWLVFEHLGQSGARVERRVLATAGQVSATAAIALSRAILFQQTRTQATTDALTKLSNRRTFDVRLADLTARLPAAPFALIIADVDRFKAVNDTYGHQVGDQVLQAVAATLRATAPVGALVSRYGGEEFAILLPGADPAAAVQAAEQLRISVAALRDPLTVTASFGVSAAVHRMDSNALLRAADAALYRAKEGGRNAVELAASFAFEAD